CSAWDSSLSTRLV
nr:immunoglobulin light chain junction region [Macaca mulatta]MPO09024.1 immunoglobulin light chain junction region [Macaca mulatta]